MWRFLLAMSFAFAIAAGFPPAGLAQGSEIVSEHIRMGIPLERQWLGREVISELERFWRYVNSVVDGNMPRRVVVCEHLWQARRFGGGVHGR